MRLDFSALSIRAKIILISITVSFVVLLIFGSALSLYESKAAYRDKELSAEQQSRLVAKHLGSELHDPDLDLITESLQEDKDFSGAKVYDPRGNLLLTTPPGRNLSHTFSDYGFDDFSERSRIYREPDNFILRTSIKSGNETIGYILTEYSYTSVKYKIDSFTVTLLTAILTAFLLATLVSIRLQGLITNRLLEFLSLIKEIATSKDYSLSLTNLGSDEIGILSQNFNLMLSEINQRDLSLRLANLSLESRVKERTKELEIAIKGLQNAQEVICAKHQQVLAVIANAPTAMAMLDLDQRLLVSSIKWSEELGSLTSENNRRIISFARNCPDSWQMAFERAISGETSSASEDYFHKADGSTVFVRWAFQPLYLDDEVICGAIVAVENITDLVKARDSAIMIAKTRTQFMANVSHELRTPLNGIIGFADILQDSYKEGEEKEYVDLIKSSGETLLKIINDVLDFSKLERGSTELESIPLSPHGVSNEVIKLFSASCKSKNISLKSEIADDVPRFLLGDEFKLKQILTNLVGNSVKFTQKGSICLKLAKVGEKQGKYLLQFSVEDSGVGIHKDRLEEIFKPFSQADGSVTRQFGGTGLGLSIASGIVSHMGGKLQVESEPGVGSRFFFTIALASDPNLPEFESENKAIEINNVFLKDKKVLIAEDNIINLKLLARILEKAGCNLTLVEDGHRALETFKQQSFDIILLDMQMPIMGGLETCDAIRTLTELGGDRIPIVALTAHAFEEDKQRCLKAGMNSFLTKPIDRASLLNVLSELISANKNPV